MNEKLTDRNVLDDVLLTFLNGPMTPLPYDLSLVFWDPISSDKDTVGLIWSRSGPAVRISCCLWAWPLCSDESVGLDYWITVSISLSLISVSNNGLLTSHVRHQAPGIPSSCSPIWIFMPHCQLPFSPDLSTVLSVHHPSKIWTLRRKEVKWAQITPRLGSWPCDSQCSVIQEERGAT